MRTNYKTYMAKFENLNIIYCVDENKIDLHKFVDIEADLFVENMLNKNKVFMVLETESLGPIYYAYN